jgi:hypothetical protein
VALTKLGTSPNLLNTKVSGADILVVASPGLADEALDEFIYCMNYAALRSFCIKRLIGTAGKNGIKQSNDCCSGAN